MMSSRLEEQSLSFKIPEALRRLTYRRRQSAKNRRYSGGGFRDRIAAALLTRCAFFVLVFGVLVALAAYEHPQFVALKVAAVCPLVRNGYIAPWTQLCDDKRKEVEDRGNESSFTNATIQLNTATESIRRSRPVKKSSQLPECSPTNLQLSQASSNGVWYLLPDGSFRYEMKHCKLRRFTAVHAHNCLQGSHLVFLGDSVSRYFYVALAYFFANQRWPDKWAALHSNEFGTHPKSVLSEKDFDNWADYYYASNLAMLHGAPVHSHPHDHASSSGSGDDSLKHTRRSVDGKVVLGNESDKKNTKGSKLATSSIPPSRGLLATAESLAASTKTKGGDSSATGITAAATANVQHVGPLLEPRSGGDSGRGGGSNKQRQSQQPQQHEQSSAATSSGSSSSSSWRSVEICDCFRDDLLPWFNGSKRAKHQQLSMTENRHFRFVPPPGNWDDTQRDVRLSYLQWLGETPMKGHMDFSTKLPRGEGLFSYVNGLADKLCPAGPGGSGLPPSARTAATATTRANNNNNDGQGGRSKEEQHPNHHSNRKQFNSRQQQQQQRGRANINNKVDSNNNNNGKSSRPGGAVAFRGRRSGRRRADNDININNNIINDVGTVSRSSQQRNLLSSSLKDVAESAQPPLVGNGILPVSGECSRNRSFQTRFDFPQFSHSRDCKGYPKVVGPRCQLFEHKVLQPMGATHLILNIGWHSGLFPEANSVTGEGGLGSMFLDKVVKAAAEIIPDFTEVDNTDVNGAPLDTRTSSTTTNNNIQQQQQQRKRLQRKQPERLFLPRVTWRATTAGGPFALWTERLASSYARGSLNRTATDWWGKSASQLGYFDVLKMTEYLRDLQDKLLHIDKQLRMLNSRSSSGGTAGGGRGGGADARTAASELKQLLESLKLHSSFWGSDPTATAATATATATSAADSGYHRTSTSKSSSTTPELKRSDVKSIFLDHAHPEPWVYEEIHNLFFNAVCSLNTTQSH